MKCIKQFNGAMENVRQIKLTRFRELHAISSMWFFLSYSLTSEANTVAKMMNINVAMEIVALDEPLPPSTCKYVEQNIVNIFISGSKGGQLGPIYLIFSTFVKNFAKE